MKDLQKGYIFNFISILMMAIGPLLSKFGLLHISPAKAAIINTLTIIATSYIWSLVSRKTINVYFDKNSMIMAVFNSMGVICLFISMDLLSPVQIGFLGRFYTVFAVIFSVLILKEKITKGEVGFIILAIFGAFLFVEKSDEQNTVLIGSLFALLYTLFFALTNVYIKKILSNEKSSNSILFTNNCITLIFVLLYAGVIGELFNGGYSLKGSSIIVVSSIITGFLGTIFLYEALKYLRFSIANVTRAISPLFLAVISYPFFPVMLDVSNIIGAIILLVSILLLTVTDKETKKQTGSVSH